MRAERQIDRSCSAHALLTALLTAIFETFLETRYDDVWVAPEFGCSPNSKASCFAVKLGNGRPTTRNEKNEIPDKATTEIELVMATVKLTVRVTDNSN